jgi:hypothetical protein
VIATGLSAAVHSLSAVTPMPLRRSGSWMHVIDPTAIVTWAVDGTGDALQGQGAVCRPPALENIMKVEMIVMRILFAASSLMTACVVGAVTFGLQ